MNELLREHVTRVGFDLTLGKSHIAALVYLDESLKDGRQRGRPRAGTSSALKRAFSWFGTGTGGLIERGLVLHHYTIDKRIGLGAKDFRRHYTITPAGKLVVALLKESGIYAEYASALVAEKAS